MEGGNFRIGENDLYGRNRSGDSLSMDKLPQSLSGDTAKRRQRTVPCLLGGDFAHAQYCLNRYLEEGWIPIIAHAERYCRTFSSVENIHALKEAGCLVQVNYYDLAEEPDHEIRTCAQNLLQAELVDMKRSDAHRTDHRAPKLARGAKYIKENCRAEYAENVLRRNAERLLMGTQ